MRALLFCFVLLGLIGKCAAALPDFTDHYEGLLPAGFQIRDSTARMDAAGLSKRRIALVTGHNFEKGVKHFREAEKFQANVNALVGLLAAQAESRLQAVQGAGGPAALLDDLVKEQLAAAPPGGGDPVMESSSPARIAEHMLVFLGKVFGKVELHPDLASARDSKVDYIAVFDFGFIRHSMTDWTRVAKLDLLTPGIERLVAASATHRPVEFETRLFESRQSLNQRMVDYHLGATNALLGGLKADFARQLKERSK